MPREVDEGVTRVLVRAARGQALKEAWEAEGKPGTWKNVKRRHTAASRAAEAEAAAAAATGHLRGRGQDVACPGARETGAGLEPKCGAARHAWWQGA